MIENELDLKCKYPVHCNFSDIKSAETQWVYHFAARGSDRKNYIRPSNGADDGVACETSDRDQAG